jgi:hypothetical protein
MINYTVNCNIVVLDMAKGDELFTFLQQHFGNNIDQFRGNCCSQDVWPSYGLGNTELAKFISFWATYSNQEERNLIYDTINSNKQYCLFGEDVTYQIIQKFDTGSPTFGSPLYNIVTDQWGIMC